MRRLVQRDAVAHDISCAVVLRIWKLREQDRDFARRPAERCRERLLGHRSAIGKLMQEGDKKVLKTFWAVDQRKALGNFSDIAAGLNGVLEGVDASQSARCRLFHACASASASRTCSGVMLVA